MTQGRSALNQVLDTLKKAIAEAETGILANMLHALPVSILILRKLEKLLDRRKNY